MPIKTTPQTIGLTCDLCQKIQDRVPVTDEVWHDIGSAGWVVSQKKETCICPDCLNSHPMTEITAVPQLDPFLGYLIYATVEWNRARSGFYQLDTQGCYFQGEGDGVSGYKGVTPAGGHGKTGISVKDIELGAVGVRFATAAEAAVIEMSCGVKMKVRFQVGDPVFQHLLDNDKIIYTAHGTVTAVDDQGVTVLLQVDVPRYGRFSHDGLREDGQARIVLALDETAVGAVVSGQEE